MKISLKTVGKLGGAVAGAAATAVSAKKIKDIQNKTFCPVCEVKKLVKKARLTQAAFGEYNNGVALTPPMGWSSWNLFARNISEDLIKEIAIAMEKTGLRDAGYIYVNVDDCWQASDRDENGKLMSDRKTFPSGIKALSEFMNAHGMKLGMYSSNGYLTCEDYPASLRKEAIDADTLAQWGVEYFKYDFCHNVPISCDAPKICLVEIADKNGNIIAEISPDNFVLSGLARLVPDDTDNNFSKMYVDGLGSANGSFTVSFNIPSSDDYIVTLVIVKEKGDDRFVIGETADEEYHIYSVAARSKGSTRRVQTTMKFAEGENTIKFHNPVGSTMDSSAIQYKLMGKELKRATREYAEKTGTEEKPIIYSICEWGRNFPYKWGAEAGNLWRTTPDIRPTWPSILGIYEHNVTLWKYASKGAWNDPDMLEVGNGKLTYDENVTHFSLWCMMAAPLILGNDIRSFILSDGSVDENNKTLQILKNKSMIDIDQDDLGVQGRRVKFGVVDVIAKPLANGKTAVCVFNKVSSEKSYSINLSKLANEQFLSLTKKDSYDVFDVWAEESFNAKELKGTLGAHACKVYIVS